MKEMKISPTAPSAPTAPQYIAPRIESVTKPDDLAREVQYAGATDATLIFG